MIYEFVLQMIVPEANLLPVILRLAVIQIPDDDIELVVILGVLTILCSPQSGLQNQQSLRVID